MKNRYFSIDNGLGFILIKNGEIYTKLVDSGFNDKEFVHTTSLKSLKIGRIDDLIKRGDWVEIPENEAALLL